MMTDTEALDYVRALLETEQRPGHAKATLLLGPFTAFSLIGLLQLVSRHPDLSDTQREIAQGIIDQMAPLFDGTPGAELVAMSNDPSFDVPRGGQT